MRNKLFLLLAIGVLLTAFPTDVLAGRSAEKNKKPITEEHIRSGAFRKLQQVTEMGPLDLHILYESSGAQNFREFATALMVAQLLRLDRALVLRALYEKKLDEILQDFAVPGKQAKAAIKAVKKELKRADK
ncbi:hypothetical protein MYX75_13595, partial [Acidobacteria bacterium AH-259-A15]|nr:hypothetical protein [Acidobacteria bacterium AH-259-A15]